MYQDQSLAVLISGGLDSAILLGRAVEEREAVHPLFIRCGLFWEPTELAYLERFLAALKRPNLRPLTILEQPIRDLYPDHWSVTGQRIPRREDPDEMVFLPGRNVWLLSKAMLWCHANRVPAVALGSLQTNPFPDATTEFFADLQSVVNRAVGGAVQIALPFGGMQKQTVMLLGRDLPLEHSFSCIDPKEGLHCGHCNKCGERRHAFEDAGLPDPTQYADSH